MHQTCTFVKFFMQDGVVEQAWGHIFGVGLQRDDGMVVVPRYEDDPRLATLRDGVKSFGGFDCSPRARHKVKGYRLSFRLPSCYRLDQDLATNFEEASTNDTWGCLGCY